MSNGCRINKPGHRFDPVIGSGDADECGRRSDGRIVINGTEKYPGPEYTPAELHQLLQQQKETR